MKTLKSNIIYGYRVVKYMKAIVFYMDLKLDI